MALPLPNLCTLHTALANNDLQKLIHSFIHHIFMDTTLAIVTDTT